MFFFHEEVKAILNSQADIPSYFKRTLSNNLSQVKTDESSLNEQHEGKNSEGITKNNEAVQKYNEHMSKIQSMLSDKVYYIP